MRGVLVAWLAVACACHGAPSEAGDLQPATYLSSSGKYALSVDPGERTGAGSGQHELKAGTKTLWSKRLPFTLREAVVTDDGIVGGYAYSRGEDDSGWYEGGDFIVALIDSNGAMRMSERAPRSPSRFLHMPANPHALATFFHGDSDRFVVRVADPDLNASSESWWTYRVSDGRSLGKFQPKRNMPDPGSLGSVVAARPVPGTPLTLVQWLRSPRDGTDFGAAFALVDPELKPVWTLVLPRDYVAAESDPKDRLLPHVREHGSVLAVSGKRFDLWHASAGERVSYAIEARAGPRAWNVREVSRVPHAQAPVDKAVSPGIHVPEIEPTLLGTLRIVGASDRPDGPWSDISDFSQLDGGRIAVLEGCGCGTARSPALVVVDRRGRLLRRVALPEPSPESGSAGYHHAWLGGDRFVVTLSAHGVGTRSSAAIVDVSDGSVRALRGFDAPEIEAVAPLGDDGFVAVTTAWSKHTAEDGISAYRTDGTLLWTKDDHSLDSAGIISPDDIAVTTTGDVFVLDNIRDSLAVFGRDGRHLRTIDLEATWKRNPNYPTDIDADADGGLIVHDFGGTPEVVRMDRNGAILDEWTPAFRDGRRFDVRGNVRAAPDGKLWTSDGVALFRLDRSGRVDEVLGSAPEMQVLGEVEQMVVRPNGWVYAMDRRTGAVHVFDDSGTRRHVCRPDVAGDDADASFESFAVSGDGTVFIERTPRAGSMSRSDEFIRFAADGSRIGIMAFAAETTQTWHGQPGGSNVWVAGYENLYLVDHEMTILQQVQRLADRRWLLSPDPVAVAPDGSIAVASAVEANAYGWAPPDGTRVTTYSNKGEAVHTSRVPPDFIPAQGRLAYDGQSIAFLTESNDKGRPRYRVVLADARGDPRSMFVPSGLGPDAALFLVKRPKGRELWLFDGEVMRRYALP